MILYFSGTGNSMAISRQLAERLGEQVMPLNQAVKRDLSQERRIGLVFPCYWFNAPRAVTELVPRLRISEEAYVFIVIPCGAQAGNAIWTVRRMLVSKGVEVAYSHKIRVPDNSAVGFGRNPNDQVWKFDRYAGRLERIAADIAAGVHRCHFAWWGLAGALCAIPAVQRRTLPMLTPAVNADRCIACGICAKVCPQGNITICDGKACCGDDCTQCLACVHFCPQQAVEINSKPTPNDHQYHHPRVTFNDILGNNNKQ